MFGTDMEVYSVIDEYLDSKECEDNENSRDDTEKTAEQDTSE